MGECGCSAFSADYKFNGPNGITYVIQICESCLECCTPAGIIIYAFTDEDMKLWDCNELPELDVCYEGAAIPVIDPAILKRLMKEDCGKDSYEAIVCEEGIDGCFQQAVSETITEWAKKSGKLPNTLQTR